MVRPAHSHRGRALAGVLRRRRWIRLAALGSLLLSVAARGQTGIAVLTGPIVDASTHDPQRHMEVNATTPSLQGHT